jgi:hypothetical protein
VVGSAAGREASGQRRAAPLAAGALSLILPLPPTPHPQAEIKRRRQGQRGEKKDVRALRMPSKDASSFDVKQ